MTNRQVTVPGLGVLIFDKTSTSTGFASVTAVGLRLTALNTVVYIAHAETGIVG